MEGLSLMAIDVATLYAVVAAIMGGISGAAIGFMVGVGWERNDMIAMQVDNMTMQGRLGGLRAQCDELRDEIYRLHQLVDPVISAASLHVAKKALAEKEVLKAG